MDNINVKKSYNSISEQWKSFRNSTPINKCIVDFSKYIEQKGTILDVGCGTGYPVASYLDSRGFHVTGIDISEKMIDYANQLKLDNSNFLMADILEYRPETTYNAVIAMDSLWHIPLDKQIEVYSIISSLLTTDGYFLFTHGKGREKVITKNKMYGEDMYFSSLEIIELQKALLKNNLKIIHSIEDYDEETTGQRELIVVAQKV